MCRLTLVVSLLAVSAGAASAQSALERLLGQIDGATNHLPVTGLYANIAETVSDSFTSTTTVTTPYAPVGTEVLYSVAIYNDEGPSWIPYLTVTQDMLGTSGSIFYLGVEFVYTIGTDGTFTIDPTGPAAGYFDIFAPNTIWTEDSKLERILVISGGVGTSATAYATGADYYDDGFGKYYFLLPAVAADLGYEPVPDSTETVTTVGTLVQTIDGAITNRIAGVTAASAAAGTALAFAAPVVDLGDMSSTVLGAVNTGEIALGATAALNEARAATSRAVAAAVTQTGGRAGATALVLNVAHGASAVNGAIDSTMTAVGGSVGNLSTTVLGAVNTGAITSGVDTAVQGIIGTPGL